MRTETESRQWSAPVNGLRVRLIANGKRYKVGTPIRLLLEIQNVSDESMVFEVPDLPSSVTRPGQRSGGWALTGERKTTRDGLVRDRQRVLIDSLRRARELTRLAPGRSLRIEIELKGGEMVEQKLKELDREDEPRQEQMWFGDHDLPGTYEFRATFSRYGRDERKVLRGGWAGDTLISPPVRIELTE